MFIDYIEAELGTATWNSSHEEASWDCPFCVSRGEGADTRKRFGFNEEKLLGHCFNCGWRGNAVTFVRDIKGVTWKDAIDAVNIYTDFKPLPNNIFDEVYSALYLEGYTIEEAKHPPKLPSDFKLLSSTQSIQKQRFIDYAHSRGVTDEQIAEYRMGFCVEGEVEFSNGKKTYLNNHLFVLNPSDSGITYWMARALNKNTVPKTFNPPSSNTIIGKSDVVFNLDKAKETGVLVITEGVFDALTVGPSGVALFGKMMSTQQYLSLISSGVDTVYVMLDGDAREHAIKACERLAKAVKNVYFCDLGSDDPNDLGTTGCLRALQKAERFTTLSSIKILLGG